MAENAFTIDKNGSVVYAQPPPLSAEKRQFIAPLGSNLGQKNQPTQRKRKRNFDGKEYNLIGLTRFREGHKASDRVLDFQHETAKNLVKKLNKNGWNARVVRWKNQSGVYVRPKYTPNINYPDDAILRGQKIAPVMKEYFTGKDKSNMAIWPRWSEAVSNNKKSKLLGNRRANLAERPIIFHRKLSEAQKEKEGKERNVMQYVDEMSDDRSHGNEYLGYAAMKVKGEIEEGKIPKDMEIVKQKIAEYMAEYENETREYNRLVGDLWEFGDADFDGDELDLPFGGEFKNMPRSMKEELFDEIQKEIESFDPQPYREKLDRLSESFDSDIQYLSHGGQRIVYEPTVERSGKLKGKVLKVNREFEKNESFDRFIREQNEFKNSTGYWEDYVSEYFKETAPFMLKYIVPAETINDKYGDLAKHTVLQEKVNIPELYEGIESVIVGDKKYDDFSLQDIGLNYMTLDLQWKQAIRDEIKSQAEAGNITAKKRKELEDWVEKTDAAWQNFGVGDDMRLRLLDYEANPTSSFPKIHNPKVGGRSR